MIKTSASPKKASGKPGRKATGLRDLPPEAARLAVNRASLRAVEEAIDLQRAIVKSTGHAAPSLLRLMRQDVQLTSVRLPAGEDGELVSQAVVRAASAPLARRMQADRFAAELVRVGLSFEADVEQSRIGNMTSSYGEGGGGGGVKDYAFVQAARMQRLLRAQDALNDRERPAIWGYVVFGLPLRDIGWVSGSARLGPTSGSLCDVGALFVEAALERMKPHYDAIGDRG